ncbi:MAG: hypothetical protein AABZ78_05755 [Chloroflexota bacterium]
MSEDRDLLVALLRARGVDYLTPSDAAADRIVDDETLICSLAAHSDSRLRQALIALFFLNPELNTLVLRLRDRLDGTARQELIAFYTAAMYLQTMWRIRLSHYVPTIKPLIDYFSAELCLPSPEDEYGKAGLYALANWHASQSSLRFNYLSAYQGVVDLVFASLKLKRSRHESTPTR